MMTDKKSLKRNKNLVVFSKEHYHGLVFSNHLKMASKATDDILKLYIADFWDNHLKSHFKNEEVLLLPLMAEGNQRKQFVHEHFVIENQINQIKDAEINVQQQAIELGQLINNHIRFEERVLFPWLEKTLTSNQLIKIGEGLKDNSTVHCFYPEFWKF